MHFLNSRAIALIAAYAAYLAWYFATVSCRRVPESQARRDYGLRATHVLLCPGRSRSGCLNSPFISSSRLMCERCNESPEKGARQWIS